MITFQELLRRLSHFWEKQGCIIHQGHDLETGAGTFNPATFLRCLGPEPYKAAYIEPCRRPTDGRYGQNPNRVQHYFQFQVILKPSPLDIQDVYLESLRAIGFDLSKYDIRFVHDDWESPTLGAWGLGWEVWMDGMEITQFTYFQNMAGISLKPITGEITYGLERVAMYLQEVDSFFDLQWDEHLTYGDIYKRSEEEWSAYNFEIATSKTWFRHFDDYEAEARKAIEHGLPLPAYDFVMKASHAFNLLDARGVISVSERTGYINRIRDLACLVAEAYIESREKQGYPLLKRFSFLKEEIPTAGPLSKTLQSGKPEDNEDFLLEIGSEELPASFVVPGCNNLEKAISKLLNEEGIPFKMVETYGTPRRLSILVKGLALAKPSKVEERRGPALAKAFDEDGLLTPAGQGFLRSIAKDPITRADIENDPVLAIREVKNTPYLFANIEKPAVATADILAERLPSLILGLDFPKKMRWGSLDISYARPIQWIVALFGSETVPFVVGTVLADRMTYGHRQLSSGEISLQHAREYVQKLKERHVLASIAERKQAVLKQIETLEKSIHGTIIEHEQVIPQVVNLTEWPQLTVASFDTAFLKIPKEVIISEMVEHQKYFPVANEDGSLQNSFIITADTHPTDAIREGNQKVLSARLADGVFLYEKDLKNTLDSFNEKLKNVTFLKGLGTQYDKVERLVAHTQSLQKLLNIGVIAKAQRAAQLCKADLASNMVFEFPDLQGTIGKYYALAQGEDKEVALAIEEHWLPRGEQGNLPSTNSGTIVSLGDKLDNLISCFALGLRPTSSGDPYALRRQALGLIRILIAGKYTLPLAETIQKCLENFPKKLIKDPKELSEALLAFFANRIKTVFQDYGLKKDEVEASISFGYTDIYDTFCRVQALHHFRDSGDRFPQLYEVYKRAKGQLNGYDVGPFSKGLLKEKAEMDLDAFLCTMEQPFAQAMDHQNYDKAYQLIAEIQPILAELFDRVKILADDTQLRDNRIALLQRVFDRFSQLLDFSKIQEKQ